MGILLVLSGIFTINFKWFSSSICSCAKILALFFRQEIDNTAKDHSADENSKSSNTESIWVEGLVPGIDFCNHSKGSII